MSIEQRRDDILKLLTENGPMGVNALARELNVPLTTLQKYLHRQSYFKINDDKKWDLPERVIGDIKSNSLLLMANVVENNVLLLQSQLEEMMQHVQNSLVPISTIKKGINAIGPSVASASENKSVNSTIDPRLSHINEMKSTLSGIFRKQKDKIPDEYKDLIFNFDYVGLVVKEGEDYTREFLENNLYDLLMGKTDELSEDTITILKENQMQTK